VYRQVEHFDKKKIKKRERERGFHLESGSSKANDARINELKSDDTIAINLNKNTLLKCELSWIKCEPNHDNYKHTHHSTTNNY
jgi:hypothetical protein